MTPLHEQLRNAADDCTPSPLKDLLNRAADAVDNGAIVVTKTDKGAIVAVTRQDDEGRIIDVIAQDTQSKSDAVDVKQEPVAWASDNVIPLRGLKDNHPTILTATKCAANPIPLFTHPAPIPDGMMLVPVEPTLEMQHAYFSIIDANMDRVQTDATFGRYANNRLAYQAMLKAAGESHE